MNLISECKLIDECKSEINNIEDIIKFIPSEYRITVLSEFIKNHIKYIDRKLRYSWIFDNLPTKYMKIILKTNEEAILSFIFEILVPHLHTMSTSFSCHYSEDDKFCFIFKFLEGINTSLPECLKESQYLRAIIPNSIGVEFEVDISSQMREL